MKQFTTLTDYEIIKLAYKQLRSKWFEESVYKEQFLKDRPTAAFYPRQKRLDILNEQMKELHKAIWEYENQ